MGTNLDDHTNYTHQRTVYGDFTNSRTFKGGAGTKPPDEDVILSGDDVPIIWQTNATNGYSTPPGYPKMIAQRFSSLALKYDGRYRLFVVNHHTGSDTFRVGINTNEISNSNWTNAWDMNGTCHIMQKTHASFPDVYFITYTIGSNAYYIFDIGSGN